jgi:hypothetical protein
LRRAGELEEDGGHRSFLRAATRRAGTARHARISHESHARGSRRQGGRGEGVVIGHSHAATRYVMRFLIFSKNAAWRRSVRVFRCHGDAEMAPRSEHRNVHREAAPEEKSDRCSINFGRARITTAGHP